MKEIQSCSPTRLTNATHYMFMANVAERAEKDSSVAEQCAAQMQVLREAVSAEDENLQISAKSLVTDKIAEADHLRDQLYAGYKKTVAGYAGFPVESLADAAKILGQHIKDYKIDTKAQLDAETGLLINFIQDLEGKFTEQVKTLSLKPFCGEAQGGERGRAGLDGTAHGRALVKDGGRIENRPRRKRRSVQDARAARERPRAH